MDTVIVSVVTGFVDSFFCQGSTTCVPRGLS